MTPQLLRQYLEVVTDWLMGVGGIVLAVFLLLHGHNAQQIAGSLAAVGLSAQSLRKSSAIAGK